MPELRLDLDRLTKRQREVCKLLVNGHNELEIAKRLGCSKFTVHNHIRAIYERYGVHSRDRLVFTLLANHHASSEHLSATITIATELSPAPAPFRTGARQDPRPGRKPR